MTRPMAQETCGGPRDRTPISKTKIKIAKVQTVSSNVQLEGLKLGSDGAATWARRGTTAIMFANQNVDALLAQTTDAFRACIAVAQYG